MSRFAIEKLINIINECDKHLLRICLAYSKIEPILPITAEKYQTFSDDEIEHIDQYLFRFAKLQDAMGQRFFKWLLIAIDEDVEGKPFIDILNKLEKLSLLDSSEQWRQLREIRNEISHQYHDEPVEMSIALNNIFQAKAPLEAIYIKLKQYTATLC